MTFLTDDPLEESKRLAREAFLVFEHREGSKMVDEREIPTVVRSMGINPSAMQLQMILDKLKEAAGENETQFVTLENFEMAMARFMVEEKGKLMRDDYHHLLRAFAAFDPERKGYIEVEMFKNVMASSGDAMNKEEISKMVAAAADDDGNIYYEEYAYKLANDGRII